LLGYKEPLLRKDGGLANASLTIIETHDFETFTLNTWNDTSYQS
ncbi:TPA: histidine phosphatase family protein, partial [Streptococcus pneumoniae]